MLDMALKTHLMHNLTTAVGLCNKALSANESLRADQPIACFQFEQAIHSVVLNLVLALYNICFEKPPLVVEMFTARLIDFLVEYMRQVDYVQTLIVEVACQFVAVFFEFKSSFSDHYFQALLLNQVGNELLPLICQNYFYGQPSEQLWDAQAVLIYCLSCYMDHLISIKNRQCG